MQSGETVETATVGRDGVVNGTAALGGKVPLHKGVVQVSGKGSAIAPDVLRGLASGSELLTTLLIRNEQMLLAQAQQSAGCFASHTTQARLCRWLLRMRDLTQSDEMTVTQEYLAQMLGVRRTSISIVAAELQRLGLIHYSRGNLRLVDIAALRQCACECYETIKAHASTC